MAVDLHADIQRFAEMGALGTLLADHSTCGNIVWATSVFADRGEGYQPTDEITTPSIAGDNLGIVCTRAQKAQSEQAELTRKHAEVFTPTWVCKKMIDYADDQWWEQADDATWKDYVSSTRLEITCGEAPFLVNRYDAADGSPVPLDDRCGIFDRKLRFVSEHVRTRKSWMRWALVALKSTYGYEFQGDNLLIARINVLCTLEDFAEARGFAPLTTKEYEEFARIISWNLWQMDGLTDCVPLGAMSNEGSAMRLPGFDDLFGFNEPEQLSLGITLDRGSASIFDWNNGFEVEFCTLKREGATMKFDYVIGNPPYQDDNSSNGRQPPIYDKFMDCAFGVGDVVELITPARFLFNAGQTSKEWNRRMLADDHLAVLFYEPNAIDVFPNTDIKGGVAITLRDSHKQLGPIGFYSPVAEMNPIISRVGDATDNENHLDAIVSAQGVYKFSDHFFTVYPNALSRIGGGTGKKVVSRFVETFDEAFTNIPPISDSNEYVGLLIRTSSGRAYKYIARQFIEENPYLNTYNVLVPKANGSGKFGEVLSSPEISICGNGSSDTFISIGMFETQDEANALLRYLKTKFSRALLNAKKVTQDNPKAVWSLIPLQDFTPNSDIDWSQSVADIDRQLYAKYGLSDEEISFIETHVKEMN